MTFKIGDSASTTRKITDAEVRAFAEISGDCNPVHLDDEFAKQTIFGRRIAHGMLTASLISAVLANQLPGQGSIYLRQEIQFVAPVFIDDEITATVIVTGIREDKPIMKLSTVCVNQRGEKVLKGEATILVSAS